jgi:hypothetical protein
MAKMRQMLFGVLLAGMAGTLAELLLTSHTEDAWQWAPVVLLAAGLPVTLATALRPAPPVIAGMRLLMLLCIAAGALGTYFHFHGNSEFVAELSPGLTGFAFFAEVMTRSTPPPLAPGTMIILGLLGLVCCYRLPEPRVTEGD